MNKNCVKLLYLLVVFVFICSKSWADEGGSSKFFKGIEVLVGAADGRVSGPQRYKLIPVVVDFDFDLKYFTKKIGFNPPMLLDFQIEPYIAAVYQPNTNVEFGNGFILKIGFLPDTWTFQPYFKIGPGILYTTQHTANQSTQFNFFEYAGVGMHYFFKKNIALTVEYRYRHLSNAYIKTPNWGIENQFILGGIAYKF